MTFVESDSVGEKLGFGETIGALNRNPRNAIGIDAAIVHRGCAFSGKQQTRSCIMTNA